MTTDLGLLIILRILILISFFLFSYASYGAREADLEEAWDQLIDAPWRACRAEQFRDDLTPSRMVAYRRCGKNSDGQPVLIIPGYTEPAMKYIELLGDLAAKMPALGPWYLLDLPGQGASERLVDLSVVDRRVVHVDIPERYPLAVQKMIQQIIMPENSNKSPFVIAHSTGALVFMSAGLNNPRLADKIVMTAPLLRPKMPFPNIFVSTLAKLHCHLGFCELTAWGRATVPIEEKTFEKNISTNSRSRWLAAHKIGLKYPEYYASGTSWGWLKMAMTLGYQVSPTQAPMSPGTLMLMADDDGYIDTEISFEACRRSIGCKAGIMKGSRHEILHEVDGIRNEAIDEIVAHFMSGL